MVALGISVWAHMAALCGDDPRALWRRIWLVGPLLVVVLCPIGVVTLRKGVRSDPFGLPLPAWRVLYGLLIYYGAHFYLFIYRAQEVVRSDYTWQMFSAGWIVLFSLASAVYVNWYLRLLSERRDASERRRTA